MNIRTYTELSKLKTYEERYEYLKLGDKVGEETFGFDRYLNQMFYRSDEWKRLRNYVITRDQGCDLGVDGYQIIDQKIFVHHMNPVKKEDILNKSEILLNPEYLITVTKRTHDAIHYGDNSLLFKEPVERSRNDTCPWRH